MIITTLDLKIRYVLHNPLLCQHSAAEFDYTPSWSHSNISGRFRNGYGYADNLCHTWHFRENFSSIIAEKQAVLLRCRYLLQPFHNNSSQVSRQMLHTYRKKCLTSKTWVLVSSTLTRSYLQQVLRASLAQGGSAAAEQLPLYSINELLKAQ